MQPPVTLKLSRWCKRARSFGEERTVILSTHIMQEVEAMCDRVVMIKQGRIVTDAARSHIAEAA